MFSDFQKHIKNNFSFLKDKKLLIAISGGLDSIVLSHLLFKIKYDISFAHCNFHLREIESDLDEEFVINTVAAYNKKSYITHFNTIDYAKKNSQSIQMAARELRYNWFYELLENPGFDYLLTAHHANDNLETFLINLTRGTGLEGLKGIPEIKNKTIRPLLPFTKSVLANYAKENNLTWREDRSNDDTKYLRNKIRHEIIPVLNDINPAFMESFSHTLNFLKGSDQIVKDRIINVQQQIITQEDGLIKLDIDKLKKLNNQRAYLYELLKNYGFTEWNDVFDLLDSQSGKQVYSKTYRLIKDRDYLILIKRKNESYKKYEIFEPNSKVKVDNFNLITEDCFITIDQIMQLKRSKQIIYIDKDLLSFPIHVRKWQKGDYFYPFGMKGKKKLSKYFKDEKLSLYEKENIWLLCSENKIVWILNYRLDERFKITEQTKRILKAEIKY